MGEGDFLYAFYFEAGDQHGAVVQVLNNAMPLDDRNVPLRGAVTFWFDRAGSGGPAAVRVDWRDGTLTPTALQRFPWSKWLAIADACIRTRGEDPTALMAAAAPAMGIKLAAPPRKRPGVRGHPREHYEKVAARYLELRRTGEAAPAKAIADEWHYSENTVRGWVRRCRELGLLPPGRPGRAG